MTISLTVKEIDQYRTDPPQWVTVDLQDKKIAKVDSISQRVRPGIRLRGYLQDLAGRQTAVRLR